MNVLQVEVEEYVLLLFRLNKPTESNGVSTIKWCFQSTQVGGFLFWQEKSASILIESRGTRVSMDASINIRVYVSFDLVQVIW